MNTPRPDGPKRPVTRCFRCSYEEDRALLSRAQTKGMSVTDYLRSAVLGGDGEQVSVGDAEGTRKEAA